MGKLSSDNSNNLNAYDTKYKGNAYGKSERKLFQFKETYMGSDFCHRTRIGGKQYEFPQNSMFESMRGEKIHTGIPLCESHLKLSQQYPKYNKKNAHWEMSQGRGWVITLVNFILIVLSDLFGLIYMADPLIYFLISLGMVIFNIFMYGKMAIASVPKLLVILPQLGLFTFVTTFFPWNLIPFVYGIVSRRSVGNVVNEHNTIALSSFKAQRHDVYIHLYPEPIGKWFEYYPNAQSLIEIPKERKNFTSMNQSSNAVKVSKIKFK